MAATFGESAADNRSQSVKPTGSWTKAKITDGTIAGARDNFSLPPQFAHIVPPK